MELLLKNLEARGFVDQLTSQELRTMRGPLKFYIGFDPTAESLHLGNLVGIVALAWFQKYGHEPFVLLGGATGRIGDPSGKSTERPFLSDETIATNVLAIELQLKEMLSPIQGKLIHFFNNNTWFQKIPFIAFLRDFGKQFRVGSMLAKESVRARLNSEEGISFTEFSYQVLQAYDFYHLYKEYGVVLQLGGSDQWGNITAGVELTRKIENKTLYGMTFPLLVRSDGKKFGKSEEGAIWLSKQKLSPYQFYQHLIRIPDHDVITLMKRLTFMEIEEILDWEELMKKPGYQPNAAQKKLAEEITLFVHGKEGLETALRVTEGLSPGYQTKLDPAVFQEISKDVPHATFPKNSVGKKLIDFLVETGLTSSKGEATRLIQNGGVYLNNEKITNPLQCLSENNLIENKFFLLAAGKKKKFLITLQS